MASGLLFLVAISILGSLGHSLGVIIPLTAAAFIIALNGILKEK